LLHKQMMAEKLKERQDAAGGSQVPPPSPPQRHESWTRARQKPSGEYAEKIVSKYVIIQFHTYSFMVRNGQLTTYTSNDCM
jgi:hypothetical protein